MVAVRFKSLAGTLLNSCRGQTLDRSLRLRVYDV